MWVSWLRQANLVAALLGWLCLGFAACYGIAAGRWPRWGNYVLAAAVCAFWFIVGACMILLAYAT